MRVLVAGLEKVIEGEVIGGELLDGESGQFDLEAEFTERCDGRPALPFMAGSSKWKF